MCYGRVGKHVIVALLSTPSTHSPAKAMMVGARSRVEPCMLVTLPAGTPGPLMKKGTRRSSSK